MVALAIVPVHCHFPLSCKVTAICCRIYIHYSHEESYIMVKQNSANVTCIKCRDRKEEIDFVLVAAVLVTIGFVPMQSPGLRNYGSYS